MTKLGNGLEIYDNRCIGCEFCVMACPSSATRLVTGTLDVGGGVTGDRYYIFVEESDCILAGECISVCPTYVFSMELSSGAPIYWPQEPGSGGGGPSEPSESQQENLCNLSKEGRESASFFAKSNSFKDVVQTLKSYNDGKEHGVIFNTISGQVVPSAVIHGSESSINFGTMPDTAFSNIHTHPSNRPFSMGDVYSFIKGYLERPYQHSRFYLLTPNGSIYVLTPTNVSQMQSFLNDFPPMIKEVNGAQTINFPNDMTNEYHDVAFDTNSGEQTSYEIAMAYILDKYNAGISFSKLDSDNEFKRLSAIKTAGQNGDNPSYSQTKCP